MTHRSLIWIAIAGWTLAGLLAGWMLARTLPARPPAGPALAAPADPTQPIEPPPNPQVDLVGVRTPTQFMDQIAKAFDKPVQPIWAEIGLNPAQSIRFDLPTADAATSFRLLNTHADRYLPVDYRVYTDHVEVASPTYFARRETLAVNYDIGGLVRQITSSAPLTAPITESQAVSTITSAIQSNIDPESWRDYGGDLASLTEMGSGLLITAPRRMHARIRELLAEYERTPGLATGLQRLLRPAAEILGQSGGNSTTPAPTPPQSPQSAPGGPN